MKVCREGHKAIAYSDEYCPLCMEKGLFEDYKTSVREVYDSVKSALTEVVDLMKDRV